MSAVEGVIMSEDRASASLAIVRILSLDYQKTRRPAAYARNTADDAQVVWSR